MCPTGLHGAVAIRAGGQQFRAAARTEHEILLRRRAALRAWFCGHRSRYMFRRRFCSAARAICDVPVMAIAVG